MSEALILPQVEPLLGDPQTPAEALTPKPTIGFVSDEVAITRYASGLLTGASEVAKHANHLTLIAEAGATPGGRRDAVEALLDAGVDGLLVGLAQPRMIDLPEEVRSIPTVVVNGASPGLYAVLPGEYEAGRVAAQHLIDHGHTRLGLIGRHWEQSDPSWSVTLPRRFAGVDDVMANAGLDFEIEYEVSDWEPEMGYEGAVEMLEASEVTAIITGNDRLAFGVYNAAHELGLDVPSDLSVVSFDDEALAEYMRPGLDTIHLPYEEMGRIGTRLLLDLLQGKEPKASCTGPACEILVPSQLVQRGSVAPVS